MILYPFETFSSNEWFILTTIAINIVVIWLLPKKLPVSLTVLLLLTGMMAAKTADFILAIPPYDLYNLNDSSKYEISDLMLSFVYPPFHYYFIYIYHTKRLKGFFVFLYILAVAWFAAGFEYLAHLTGVYNYKGWSLIYSFPVYLTVLGLSIVLYHVLMRAWKPAESEK
ncbi:MAG: hypothetical protein K0S39_1624 [Paenibacillus sp.]|jgi:hypothetical protein|nr:hypothetical protein [Paenibacillus sp.]